MSRSRFSHTLVLSLGMVLCFTLLSAPANAQRFKVTVTNITSGEVFTPIMVASHKAGVKLFTLGTPASVELEQVAEAGDLAALETSLRSNRKVLKVVDSGAPLPPGQSVTLTVEARGPFDHVSVVSMLVPTNDAFFAVNGADGPDSFKRTVVYYSPAYDAGTEANDELCANIPGPPNVCTGGGFNASRDGDGNFVHIHSGIHGVGDLSAATYDWRNPVARIEITRVP
jgi:hypothetical protein